MYVLALPSLFERNMRYEGIYFDSTKLEIVQTFEIHNRRDLEEAKEVIQNIDRPALITIVLFGNLDFGNERFQLMEESKPVHGTIEGNYHAISNIELSGRMGGLLAHAENWIVRNVRFTNPKVVGEFDAGVIAGQMKGCLVRNVRVENARIEAQQHAGTIAGSISDSRVRNVHAIITTEPKAGVPGLLFGHAGLNTVVEDVHLALEPTILTDTIGSSTATYHDMPVFRRIVKDYL